MANKEKKGFRYTLEKEKVKEFQKLTYEQRLKWVEKMNRFLHKFMPPESKIIWEKLRKGEI